MVFPIMETAGLALAASPVKAEADPRIEELKTALTESPNYLQYTEYKMLKHKYPKETATPEYEYDSYYLRPTGKSPLAQEYSGGLFGPEQNGLYEGIDVLTGAQAVDESLQIGSIGFDRSNSLTTSNQRQIATALELYFNDKNKYPDTLSELSPMYIGVVPQGFTYKNLGATYSLTQGEAVQNSGLNISQVEPLTIKSHPWESMIKKNPKVPDMFSLVPGDDLMIYFRDLDKFTELEKTITAIGKPLDSIYSLSDSVAIKDKIFRRLGIKDIKELRAFIDEAGLVAYDMDAYPNTDYALILKVKSSVLNNFISNFVTAPAERRAQVGDYYVIATDKSFLDTIVNAKNSGSSLASKKDLTYALSVLESDYDGFAYFSEAFVSKLTSPAYRINARRRNTALNALETWQYTVFAYRDITKNWPNSLQQIVDEGYVAPGSYSNLGDYSVDGQGVVKHKDWGSIYNITPVSQVAISAISEREKTQYESFKQGYEQYWREFIDPVGVAITVGDQIRFHTIILPLIDKSEYNWIKDISGADGITFDFLKNPDRLPSLQLLMKINVDDALYAYYKEVGKNEDEDYMKCRDDFYKKYDWSTQGSQTLDDACKPKELSREQAIAKMKDQVAKAIDWQEKTPVFDFIGNEITLAGGENLVFNIDDLSKFDIYFGVEMKDQELGKKFLDKVFAWYGKKMSEGSSRSAGYGFFKLDTTKPIKNTYNGIDYYMAPLGFTNIYYAFINSRFYLTISQSAMNSLIDGGKNKGTKQETKWPAHMQRLFDYMGDNMNMAFVADNTKLQPWLKGMIKDQWTSYASKTDINAIKSYYTEALVLAKTLPQYNGNLNNANSYYRNPPKEWFDATLSIENGALFLNSNGQKYDVSEIDTGYSSYYYSQESTPKEKKYKLEEITKNFNVDKTLADWEKLKDLGIGFSLTKEGLDIRIAFNNVASTKLDSRIAQSNKYKTPVNWPMLAGGGLGILILGGGLGAWLYLKKKKPLAPLQNPGDGSLPAVPTPSGPVGQKHLEIPEALLSAIKTQAEQGLPWESLKANLKTAGWTEEQISSAVDQILAQED